MVTSGSIVSSFFEAMQIIWPIPYTWVKRSELLGSHVPEFPLAVTTEGRWMLPDGNSHSIQVGSLGLGEPNKHQAMAIGGSTSIDGALRSRSSYTSGGPLPRFPSGCTLALWQCRYHRQVALEVNDQAESLATSPIRITTLLNFPINLLGFVSGGYWHFAFFFSSKSGLLAQGDSQSGVR
jgi:hypothetical protein